jgi:hypothetical protein
VNNDYCQWDAAYVLGALPSAERHEFESHLADCMTCQRSLRELAGLPGLLAKVEPDDFASAPSPPPATLLPALVREVRRARTRRLRIGAAIAVAAAAAVAVTTVGIVRLSPAATDSVAGVAMNRVTDSPIHATARLTTKPWGTQIDLVCTYDVRSPYVSAARTYTLLVTNRSGATQQVATWKVVPSGASTVTGSVGWERANIAQVEIRTSNGSPVLRLRI